MPHGLTILKFGGSVLGGEHDLPRAVSEVERWLGQGGRVVAVVSAFEGSTDRLLIQARAYSSCPNPAAASLLLATGEFTTAALLALALQRAGREAALLTPGAIELRTRGHGTDADPASIHEPALRAAISRSPVVIIPGFVGVGDDGGYTLLGRGGSDLTALFIAAELSADRCRLIKDVDGLYERDPALTGPPPQRFGRITWDEALRLDGGIVQHKAVRLARSRGLEFEVGTFGSRSPTHVGAGPTVLAPASPREVSNVA